MSSRLSRFTDRLVTLSKRVVSGNPEPAVEKGNGGYADWVIVVIHGVREYLDLPYRRLLDVLHEMHDITEKMGFETNELPDFTTVCVRKQELKMEVWRTLLRLSADLHDTGEVQAIDATGFDRHSASRHYANRTDYTFRSVKTTALVDCETRTVQDVHCSMRQPHDTQVGQQVLTRNLDRVQTITADKGYDWDDLREELRGDDIRQSSSIESSLRSTWRIMLAMTTTSITSGQSLRQYSSRSSKDMATLCGHERGSGSFESSF